MRQLATAAPERMRSSAETPTGQELDLWIVAEAQEARRPQEKKK